MITLCFLYGIALEDSSKILILYVIYIFIDSKNTTLIYNPTDVNLRTNVLAFVYTLLMPLNVN